MKRIVYLLILLGTFISNGQVLGDKRETTTGQPQIYNGYRWIVDWEELKQGGGTTLSATEIVSSINTEIGTEWQSGGSDKITSQTELISSIVADNQYPATIVSDIDLGAGNLDLSPYDNPSLVFGGGYILNGDILGDFTYDIEFLRENKSLIDNENAICNYKGTYNVDPEFWGLDEVVTAEEKTNRLNLIFKWALRTPGLTRIVFPFESYYAVAPQTGLQYVSSFNDANLGEFAWSTIIKDLVNIDIDFNFSTIEQMGNPYMRSPIIEQVNTTNCKISNLNLLGDRLTHDYSFVGANGSNIHEFGHGISVLGGVNNTFENCIIKRVTGYGLAVYPLGPKGIPRGDFSISPSVRLADIEEGDIDENGINVADSLKTRSQFRQFRQVDIDSPDLFINGWALYSARGVDPGIIIKVYFYDDATTPNLLDIQYSDEGGKLRNVEGATQFRVVFDQPLYTTKWANGSIDEATGLPTGVQYTVGEQGWNSRFGYTPDFIDLTAEEIAFGGHRPDDLNIAGSEKDFGDYAGQRVFYYDATNTFISSTPYQTNVMVIPANAVKFKMTGSGTEWNDDNDRFYIGISGIRVSQNTKVVNCKFIENRCMGLAGIFNELDVTKCDFIRNGVTIQGNTKLGALGRAVDLEEGARLTRKVTFRDCRFEDSADGEILLWTVKDVLFENCYMKGKNFFAYEMNDKITIRNCEFHDMDEIVAPKGKTLIENCKLYNTTISSRTPLITGSDFFDCDIKDVSAGKIWTPFSENSKISVTDSDFYITDNFPRLSNGVANFITLNGSTEVVLDECNIYDKGTEKTYVTTYAGSVNSGFTNPVGGIGVTFKGCTIKGLYLFQDSRIKEISDSTIGWSLNFNASIIDSDVPSYGGLNISNSTFNLNELRDNDALGQLAFDLPVSINNSSFNIKGNQYFAGASYLLRFNQLLNMKNTNITSTGTSVSRLLRVGDANSRLLNNSVIVENPSGNPIVIESGVTDEFNYLLPAKFTPN